MRVQHHQVLFTVYLWLSTAMAFAPPNYSTSRQLSSSSLPAATTLDSGSSSSKNNNNDASTDTISADNPLRVTIAGAGVGGLALANTLCKHNHISVTVLEQTSAFKRFGGPIQLASNALQLIQEMDSHLYKQIEKKFTVTGDKQNGIKDGIRDTWYAQFDLTSPALARNLPFSGVIDRPDLQQIYLDSLPSGTVRNGDAVSSYTKHTNNNVTVHTQSGQSFETDVLIGADGIWSAVRSTMRNVPAKGPDSGAVYSGYTVFAGELTYQAPDFGTVGYKVYIGPQQYFVITDIGKGMYQWYAFLARPENYTPDTEIDNNSLYLQQLFENWSPDIHDILKATKENEIEQRDLYDRRPSRPWTDGPVALLGDGIHAMMPNLGQGGCQAIEDAYVLNQELESLSKKSDIADALLRYQGRRWIRSAAVQGLSRFASDIIIKGFDTPAKIGFDSDGRLVFENCNYAGIVTRLLQPILPIFFAVQFNFLYAGYQNKKGIDVGATVGFLVLGGLIASILSIEVAEIGLGARAAAGALAGLEGLGLDQELLDTIKDFLHLPQQL